ncbi:MAG TPA: rhodanese-like domain-containing protein, partial [Sandaracinaceae bacterium]
MHELSTIVAPSALASRIGELRVLDCRSGPDAHARYLERHLAGALYVDLERDLSGDGSRPERGGRHPLPPLATWCRTLGRLGIDPSTPVVLYDHAGGANAAARAWWMLRAVGHREVAVIDGGLAAAIAAGLPVESGEARVDPKPPYPASAWARPTLDIDAVARLARDPSWRLVDVRAPERYRGEREPIDPIAGHIPGAHNIPLTENLGPDGRFKSPGELRALYEARLGDPARTIVSCGSGVTACHTLLALEHAGLVG